MTAPGYTELCERLDKRALKVRGYITSSLRVMELLQPEVDKFEKRSGHDLYTVRMAVDHKSSVRTQTKEAEELEQASTALASLQADNEALKRENARLRGEIEAVRKNTWCWLSGDDQVYDYPVEWAEYDLDPNSSPAIHQFSWAGRLPDTWAMFTWAGDEDGGEWNVIEYESEQAAHAALQPKDQSNG